MGLRNRIPLARTGGNINRYIAIHGDALLAIHDELEQHERDTERRIGELAASVETLRFELRCTRVLAAAALVVAAISAVAGVVVWLLT